MRVVKVSGICAPNEPIGAAHYFLYAVVGIVAVAVDQLVLMTALVNHRIYIAAYQVVNIVGTFTAYLRQVLK